MARLALANLILTGFVAVWLAAASPVASWKRPPHATATIASDPPSPPREGVGGRGTTTESAPPPIAAAPTVPVAEDEVLRGDPGRPWVALVFNVGAGSEPAMGILDTLREKQYSPTFFVMGWWAERRPDVLAAIAAGGHEVASHGHSVFDLTQVSDDAVRADLESAH